MADEQTLTAWLEEAETALHTLTSGQQQVEVEYEGSRVKYSATRIADLRRHIRDLKRKLGKPSSPASRRVLF